MIAWIARLGTENVAQPLATPQVVPAPPQASTPVSEPPPASPEATSPLVRPNIPRAEDSEAYRAGAVRSEPPAPESVPAPSPRAKPVTPVARAPEPREPTRDTSDAIAVLRVGTVPLGQVWIDGEAAGWAPVVVNLPPGMHTVAGGNTSPEVKRSVRLRAGETKRLVLSLDNDAMFGDEETDTPSRR
jgi:hypothetical protein